VTSLRAAVDDVLVVDTGSTDDTARRAAEAGAQVIHRPWEGFGTARRGAVDELRRQGHTWGVFIDSDEYLDPAASSALRRLAQAGLTGNGWRLQLNDWVTTPTRRFRFRTGYRTRLFRLEVARYEPRMLVNESPRIAGAQRLPIAIEHDYFEPGSVRPEKVFRYGLLWALVNQTRRPKPAWLQYVSHLARNLVVKGALWRGGVDAVEPARLEARYHAEKHRALARLQAGAYGEVVAAFERGAFREVLAQVERARLNAGR
jgi:(heptosyl)LPS beta-1,4-glucosyltransferase